MLHLSLRALAITSLSVGLAQAGVIVIDDDGGAGVDHTDIQAAINVASHGDILIVHPGTYSGFTLGLGLTIIGSEASDTSVVTSHVTISGVPNPRRAVLTGLRLQTMSVTDNPGHVILDSLQVEPQVSGVATVSIGNSVDVRMYQCLVRGTYSSFPDMGGHAVQVVNSRFEVIDSVLFGARGYSVDCYSEQAGHGGSGLWASNGSLLAVFDSTLQGGDGGEAPYFCEWTDPYGGNGGDGLFMRGGSIAAIAGPPIDTVEHGLGGYGDCFPFCFDGAPGNGLVVEGASSARYSGVLVSNTDVAAGSTAEEAIPADPFLERFGTLEAGRQQTFWINGTPGDQVTFYIGRAPTITVDATQVMDDLVSHERSYNLGTIPASGRKKFLFTIPTWFPTAFNFYVQAATTDSSGQRTLTNSMPMVLRHLP